MLNGEDLIHGNLVNTDTLKYPIVPPINRWAISICLSGTKHQSVTIYFVIVPSFI